jgi:hypothetical protein
MLVQCDNGTQVICEKSPYYFMVTVGDETWYWNRETGEFEGWGETKLSSFPSPTLLPTPQLQNHQLA